MTAIRMTTALGSAVLLFAAVAGAAADDDMTVNFGGRVQVDAAFYDEDATELNSGTEFRRARFFAEGNIQAGWKYKLQVDFADGDVSMKDAFLTYKGFEFGDILIGQHKIPFSLEELTSSKYITFMERGLPNLFTPSRAIGIGVYHTADNLYLGAGVFGDDAEGDNSDDEGVGVAGRVAYAPIRSDERVIHVGLALGYGEPETTGLLGSTVRFRTRPESHVTSRRLIDTGLIDNVDHRINYGLEFAGLWGPVSVQAEYMMLDLDRSMGGDVGFSGYYVYGSWFPGGQQRSYKRGSFGRTKASNAWELALRFSSVDLNDGPIMGGDQDNITLAVNYYVNPYLRFMMNYIGVDSERQGVDDDPNILQLRASMDFE